MIMVLYTRTQLYDYGTIYTNAIIWLWYGYGTIYTNTIMWLWYGYGTIYTNTIIWLWYGYGTIYTNTIIWLWYGYGTIYTNTLLYDISILHQLIFYWWFICKLRVIYLLMMYKRFWSLSKWKMCYANCKNY